MVVVTITVAALLTGCIILLSHKKNLEINELKTKNKVLQDFADESSKKVIGLEKEVSESRALLVVAEENKKSLKNEINALTAKIAAAEVAKVANKPVSNNKPAPKNNNKASQPQNNKKGKK